MLKFFARRIRQLNLPPSVVVPSARRTAGSRSRIKNLVLAMGVGEGVKGPGEGLNAPGLDPPARVQISSRFTG